MASVDGKLFQTGFTGLQDADIERFLQRTLNAEQKVSITEIITSVEHEFASRCNRNFDTDETYFEYFDSGISRVTPNNTPIATLEGVTIDGVDKTTDYTLNSNYWIRENEIDFLVPLMGASYGYNAVTIEYTIKKFWGDDVVRAIKEMVARNYLSSGDGGVNQTNNSFSNISQGFDLAGFQKHFDDTIFRYTNFSI